MKWLVLLNNYWKFCLNPYIMKSVITSKTFMAL